MTTYNVLCVLSYPVRAMMTLETKVERKIKRLFTTK